MDKEFHQTTWDSALQDDLQELLRLALREDLGELGDITTTALVPEGTVGQAAVVARQGGIIAGLPAAEIVLRQVDARLQWTPYVQDGQAVQAGDRVALVAGPARGILTAERLMLNLLGRLSGIASLARKYVDAVAGTKARIFDTRKTTTGWRRLEKYAVRAGGAWNHRTGLFDAILIKDNHLAQAAGAGDGGRGAGDEGKEDGGGRKTEGFPCHRPPATRHPPPTTRHPSPVPRPPPPASPAEAVRRAQEWIRQHVPEPDRGRMIVEIEVDSLEQLEDVLPAGPDIVLLDNMTPAQLCAAVARRNAVAPAVELEASGGVSLDSVRTIAESGVERISVGGLTHSAASLDIALDWSTAEKDEE